MIRPHPAGLESGNVVLLRAHRLVAEEPADRDVGAHEYAGADAGEVVEIGSAFDEAERRDEDEYAVDDLVGQHRLLASQEHYALLTVVGPGNDRGDREHPSGYRDQPFTQAGRHAVEGFCGELCANVGAVQAVTDDPRLDVADERIPADHVGAGAMGDGSLQPVAIKAAVTFMRGNHEDHALAVAPVVTVDARFFELPSRIGRGDGRQDIERIIGGTVPYPISPSIRS